MLFMKVVNSFLDLSVAMFARDLYVLRRKKVISFFLVGILSWRMDLSKQKSRGDGNFSQEAKISILNQKA